MTKKLTPPVLGKVFSLVSWEFGINAAMSFFVNLYLHIMNENDTVTTFLLVIAAGINVVWSIEFFRLRRELHKEYIDG
jgi:hypothetical protein